MGKIVKINALERTLVAAPRDELVLRWRIRTSGGLVITSSWTPETRYPSITATMREFAGGIDELCIDAREHGKREVVTLLRCPGHALAGLSYKGFLNASSGRHFVGGIEVEDIEGTCYLVLRDGTVHVEERKAENVANDH